MRGQRRKAAEAAAAPEQGQTPEDVEILIEEKPRRIPSPKWRDLIKKVWEVDPMLCPSCSGEMRVVALINEREVIEKILKHLGLWQQGIRVSPARGPPPSEPIAEPWLDDPFPDYENETQLEFANG